MVEVNSGHLNLYFVLKTNVVTSIPPSPIQIPSLAQDFSSSLHTFVAPFIELPIVVVKDILEDTHLLSDEKFIIPIIPPPLEIPFQDSHAFSFEHQVGLLDSPYI